MKNTISLCSNQHGIQTLLVNTVSFDTPVDLPFDLPQKSIGKIHINEFPIGVILKPYIDEVSDAYYYTFNMPIQIQNLGNGIAKLEIEACRTIQDPLFPISIGHFQLIKMDYILLQKANNPEIVIFDIDESAVHLHYTIDIPSSTITKLLIAGREFDKEITVPILQAMKNLANDMRKKLGLSLLK